MTRQLSSGDVFKSHRDSLELEWIAGQAGKNRSIETQVNPDQPLVGFLNSIRPNRIQILGSKEVHYLSQNNGGGARAVLDELFQAEPAMIIITDDMQPTESLIAKAEATNTPLFRTPTPGSQVIDYLLFHTAELLSEKVVIHGVFLQVMGIGVLLSGPSGIGKSELALDLLSRGHHLIADDAPEFVCSAPDTITGTCPPVLHDFLEVRGLGILNVRAMFGDNAVVRSKRLRLIVRMENREVASKNEISRLDGSEHIRKVLDVDIPEVVLPVAPGRNLAVIVEAAVQNHLLRLSGYDASADLIGRQKVFMEKSQP